MGFEYSRPNHCGRHLGKINGYKSTYAKEWWCTFWWITMFLTENPWVKLFECQADVFGWLTPLSLIGSIKILTLRIQGSWYLFTNCVTRSCDLLDWFIQICIHSEETEYWHLYRCEPFCGVAILRGAGCGERAAGHFLFCLPGFDFGTSLICSFIV